jgi:hypothetical protein
MEKLFTFAISTTIAIMLGFAYVTAIQTAFGGIKL